MDRRIGPRAGLAAILIGWALAAGLAGAQPTDAPPSDAAATLPPPPSLGPVVAPPPLAEAVPPPDAVKEPPKHEVPVGPVLPERSPIAVLRVLDKVTAETMRFAAPVGRRVRYKSLVFEVRACETRGVGSADPRPSAYLIIDSDLGRGSDGAPRSEEVFRGWMFAKAPTVHALQHPIYDAWLESCIAVAPVT